MDEYDAIFNGPEPSLAREEVEDEPGPVDAPVEKNRVEAGEGQRKVNEPPTETPEPGEVYERYEGGPQYRVVHVDWQHSQHRLWALQREEKGQQPPFYVVSKGGTIGWVPWPGSVVVWPYEQAWVMDLFQPSIVGDPRPSERKKR